MSRKEGRKRLATIEHCVDATIQGLTSFENCIDATIQELEEYTKKSKEIIITETDNGNTTTQTNNKN